MRAKSLGDLISIAIGQTLMSRVGHFRQASEKRSDDIHHSNQHEQNEGKFLQSVVTPGD
jgi:hypothetical protein